MKRIAIVTTTRAEYGLLSPVIKALRKYENDELGIELVVSGTHLSDRYGHTVDEIVQDGIRIDHQISIPVCSESATDISRNQAATLVLFTEFFSANKFNAVVLLGDRYEMLAIAIAAGNTKTPIFHLCGGDTTEGALDEWIRHSITKMSYLHFVTNEVSARRVIQLGEDPERVYDYGSTSIENIMNNANMNRQEVLRSIGLSDCRFALCTYHPVTLGTEEVENQMQELLMVIKSFPEIEFIVTKSNADQGGEKINSIWDRESMNIENLHVFTSLGVKRYLSLMRFSEFVLGNSSSGIIETPSFHVPTINIGSRQKGRLQAESVINCSSDYQSIKQAIVYAMSEEHREICKRAKNPYGDGRTSERIAQKAVEIVRKGEIDLRKRFYVLEG